MAPRMMGPVEVQSPLGVPDPFMRVDRYLRQVGRRRIFVQTDSGDVLDVELDRADTAEKVKKAVQAALCVPTEQSDLVFGGHVLEDLSEIRKDAPVLLTRGISRSCSSPCLSPSVNIPCSREMSKPLEEVGGTSCGPQVKRLLREAVKALDAGVSPVRATGGLGGAYYFRNRRGESIGIMKPTDEEPFAPNNPNGYVGRALGQPGLKRTIRVGEAGVREVAAYLLDHNRFANVPHTALVKATHPIFNVNGDTVKGNRDGPPTKIGSFQQYVKHDFDASEHGTSRFPVSAIHRIGILDIRVFNTDRHSGNILVRRSLEDEPRGWGRSMRSVDEAVELIPIDHGFCLPETLESAYFEWLHWPQASLPFSQEELEYIAGLDVEQEVEMLRMELPMLREGCLRILVLSTMLLQRAAAEGFSLSEIGSMMSRELSGMDEEASELEMVCHAAKQRLVDGMPIARSEERANSEGSEEGYDDDDEFSRVQFQFDMDQEDDCSYAAASYEGDITAAKFSSSRACCAEDVQRDSTSSPFTDITGQFTIPSTSSSSPVSIQGFTPPLLRLEETRALDEEDMSSSPSTATSGFTIMASVSSQFKAAYPKTASLKKLFGFHSRSSNYERPVRAQCPQSPMQRSPTTPFSSAKACIGVQGGPLKSSKAGWATAEELERAFPGDGGLNFGEMSERIWSMYLEIVKELIDEALSTRKRENNIRLKRLGTSCKF